jgi:ketosteroid isomerase-like protein
MSNAPSIPTEPAPPADVAVAFYDALLGGRPDEARRHLHDDVVLHVPGTHGLAGDHVGPDAVLAFPARSRALTAAGERIDVLDVLGGSRHAAVYCRVRADRPGRAALDNLTVHLLRVEGGRVAEGWLHNWDAVAVDEFWS